MTEFLNAPNVQKIFWWMLAFWIEICVVNGLTAWYSQGRLDGEQMIKMNVNVLNNLSQNTHDPTLSAGNELF